MLSYTFLAPVAMAFVVFGVLASLLAIGVLVEFFVSNRRDRLAHHESVRTHYRRMVLTH
ncbi:hypothetical protein [Nocardioides sp. T2.26MG-1]|uniref:hypothetical protein n=1 Tax=Nocardioides sp. T2.26MG-1 TaxID=3041166 RepID=UPI00247780A0|nr:hypothetical protein [Nocardioides sp. T2.26MG-1]CAI9408522.1 hypothetical protein HIDPHFAB_01096 [Nocardioides sp. T2.26MG-1]